MPPREGSDSHARQDRPRRRAVPGAAPPAAARILPRMLGFRGDETPPETAPAPPVDDAQYWIRRLGLRAHPEGGYYRETYRASEQLGGGQLPERFEGAPRAISTAIYFLLEGQQRSLIHRIRSDELWHFYAGDPLVLFVFEQKGGMRRVVLGRDLEDQQTLQAVVPAETWFGAALVDGGRYALVGCTVAPGFDFADFEKGERRALLDLYPQHQLAVKRLTR